MSAAWYFLVKGRPQGPVSLEEIKNEIAVGRLGARDLLYRERDTKWRAAADYAEFGGHFNREALAEDWVLLLRKPDGSGHSQRGPFSTEQIVVQLKSGEISFTDYIWRKGLKEWYKILTLPDFHNIFAIKEKSLPPLPNEVALSVDLSEITMKLPMPADEEMTMPTAEAVIDPVADTKLEIKKQIVHSQVKNKNTERFIRRTGLIRYYMSLGSVQKTVFVTVTLIVLFSSLLFIGYASSYFDRKKFVLKPPTESFVRVSPAPQEVRPEEIKPRVKPEAGVPLALEVKEAPKDTPKPLPQVAVEAKLKPSYIKFVKILEGKEEAKLKIISDGSSHYPIYVVFEAFAGQVLDAKNVQRRIRLSGKMDARELELAKTGLPSGEYNISIESEGVVVQTKFSFATELPEFKKKLHQERKLMSYSHNEERYSFFKTAARIENEAYKLVQNAENAANLRSWTAFYKLWRKNFERIQNPNIQKISTKNRSGFVHGAMWLKLKDLQKKVSQEAKALNGAKIKGQVLDTSGIKSTALDLTKLKEQMLQESLWN